MSAMTGRQRRALLLVAGVYVILALSYGLVNPLFEAPDEHWHFFTALAIAEEKQLPRVEAPPDPWLGQEAAQPPLYYLLGALIVAPVDTAGARETVWPNPRLEVGDASAVENVNAFVHGPWESWPWRGYALAAHLLRAFSSLLGLGTLLFIYQSGRVLWPERPQRALLAMAMAAFLPQFLFVHSAVSNDALITFLCAAAIWQLLRLWRGAARAGWLALLGVTVGLAMLSKTAGILLLVYACGVLSLRGLWRGEGSGRTLGRVVLFVAVPALALGGWLLLRNWILYGDVTAANQFVAIAGGNRNYTLSQVLAESGGLWTSLFAVFGWFNVRAAGWVYGVWNGLAALAIAGGAWSLAGPWRAMTQSGATARRAKDGAVIAFWLALWAALVYAALVVFMIRTPAAQGRLLFPALAPLALGMAFGLDELRQLAGKALSRFSSGQGWQAARWWLLFPAAALATSLYGLFVLLPQTYQIPPVLNEGELPAQAVALQADLGGGLALVGYELQQEPAHPGDVVLMTLYWRLQERGVAPDGPAMATVTQTPQMIAPRTHAPQRVVELFGRQERLVAKAQAYHGGGLYPAALWPADGIVIDRLGLRLEEAMQAPVVALVQVGLASPVQRVTLGGVEVEPVQWPAAPEDELALLDDNIRLVQATFSSHDVAAGDEVRLTLAWEALGDIQTSYTTFVHLGVPGKQPLAQGDAAPLAGAYPTSRWEAGEVITGDTYAVVIPRTLAPGRYPVLVGLYEAQSGQRLSLTVDGRRQDHDAYVAGWIDVR